MSEINKKFDFIEIFLILSTVFLGLFQEFLACIAGAVLCIYLSVFCINNKKIVFYWNITSASVLSIVLFYGLSVFWAVDSGDAVLGFFKFLPLAFFLLVVMQKSEVADDFTKKIPLLAAFMTISSLILMQFQSLKKYFSVAGRLSGFFQYSNTFALFLLIALIIVATKEKFAVSDFLVLPVLLLGIVYSGSRTAFVLMLIVILALILFKKNKKHRIVLASFVATVIAFATVYALLTNNFNSIGRFLTISLRESTFVGRLLYFQDAIPVILKHPFGLGYLGYNYMQYSFQTGLYSVRYIHNDFLQLMLDVGWLPTVLFVTAIIKAFFKKGVLLRKRLLILVISAHTCFDFNFQYLAIFMIFILLLDYKDGNKKEFSVSKITVMTAAMILTALFAYIGTVNALFYFKQYETATLLYPYSTQCNMALMQSQEMADAVKTAEKITGSNKYVYLPYRIKANKEYLNGNFKNVIDYETTAIKLSPFTVETYEEYCRMLINGIYLYEKAGDKYSADICKKELLNTVNALNNISIKQSRLGKMIKDQPNTELSEEIIQYVQTIEKE